ADHGFLRPLERCVMRLWTRASMKPRLGAASGADQRVRQSRDHVDTDTPHGRRAGGGGTAAAGAPDPEIVSRWRRPRRHLAVASDAAPDTSSGSNDWLRTSWPGDPPITVAGSSRSTGGFAAVVRAARSDG